MLFKDKSIKWEIDFSNRQIKEARRLILEKEREIEDMRDYIAKKKLEVAQLEEELRNV